MADLSVIREAISLGAPTYNRGDHAGCRDIYAAASMKLLESGALPDWSARLLRTICTHHYQQPAPPDEGRPTAHQADAERDARARQVFARYDANGNGVIEWFEFLQAMGDLQAFAHLPTADEKQAAAKAYFDAADTNHNGVVDEDEFLRCYADLESRHKHQEQRQSRAVAAFQHFDVDRNGRIDLNEFRRAVVLLGLVRPEAVQVGGLVDIEFVRRDANHDGGLSFDEFLAFYSEEEAKAEEAQARDGRAHDRFRKLAGLTGLYIDKTAFWLAMLGLGMFQGFTALEAQEKVEEHFPLACLHGNGVLDEAGFVRYYALMENMHPHIAALRSQRLSGGLPSVPLVYGAQDSMDVA